MKQSFKRISAVVLILALIAVLCSISCSADDAYRDGGEKLTYISDCQGQLVKKTFSTNVSASINGYQNVTSVKIKMELQKLTSGSYSTIETWEQAFSGRYGAMEKTKTTSPLSTYRLKATFTAYCGTASETKVLYVYG